MITIVDDIQKGYLLTFLLRHVTIKNILNLILLVFYYLKMDTSI